jgi:hypothetical protein
MKNSFVPRILRAGTFVLIACGLMAASSALVMAESPNDKQCSNRTLTGDYGFALEGVIIGPEIPLRGVVMQHYDGRGHITQVDHIVDGGMPPAQEWAPGAGTYSVSPDCTGVAVINSSSNPLPLNVHFVVVKHGTEIHQVVDGNAVSAVGYKVD